MNFFSFDCYTGMMESKDFQPFLALNFLHKAEVLSTRFLFLSNADSEILWSFRIFPSSVLPRKLSTTSEKIRFRYWGKATLQTKNFWEIFSCLPVRILLRGEPFSRSTAFHSKTSQFHEVRVSLTPNRPEFSLRLTSLVLNCIPCSY